MTYEEIKRDPAIRTYIARADESMAALGFTEHSFAHVGRVAETAVEKETGSVWLRLQVDQTFSSVMEYFEIFMARMILCRKAAGKLGLEFKLSINGQELI